ncbi:unnamed protein product [Adineta ricciae]|uniref:Uncharacterized protein n=1 Tax=Adineta ricciae TaxID=249248 RepID=A0A814P004_ADIRI|nr:unnamed protein product [Adineta ricciae]CAF1100876.1 unnamed protein product [Adineta ricciae]
MVNSTEQTAEELRHYVRIENLPYGIAAKDISMYFKPYDRFTRFYLKRRVAKDSQVLLTHPRVTVAYDNPDIVDEIMMNRPYQIGDCKLFLRRCLPISKKHPLEAFVTVRKMIIRTKTEHPHDILPDDMSIIEYLSPAGGKIEYFERLDDQTVLVQFDDYDPVDICCLSRPHFIGSQEIEMEKCLDEKLVRASIEKKQLNHASNIDTDSEAVSTTSPDPVLSIDDHIDQLRATYSQMTSDAEHHHQELVASLSAEWEQTAKERIRLERLAIDCKTECDRLENENRYYQKLYSESLREKPDVQNEGEAKLSDAYQKTRNAQQKYEKLLQNH